MKINVEDKYDSGIVADFARAIGATVSGRFTYIPKCKGAGYLSGFDWGSDLRMMIQNYYLTEDVSIQWTNEKMEGLENVVFRLTGIFPSLTQPEEQLLPELASVLICRQGVSSLISMPSKTMFGSVTIRASQDYLYRLFGQIDHPIVASVLVAGDNFILETGISPEIIRTAAEMLGQPVPEGLESHFYKLKCEELLCYIFALLMQREEIPLGKMHIDDIKAIYAIRSHLRSHLAAPPNIHLLAKEAAMSEPKLRRIFKQIFGYGVFEYYQSMRMQEAARMLKEKRLTVSEVGYQLGFTNLSHFSRVFEMHYGIKPKAYSLG